MRRYRCDRGDEAEWISRAIAAAGGQVLSAADGKTAPLLYRVRTPGGEEIDLVCYAFSANEYRQRRRPAGEHRFQIKYGSDFESEHPIFIDRSRRRVTLLFGIHFEKGLIVTADPEAHNPTRFSTSIAFKVADLDLALEKGWHGFERERHYTDPAEEAKAVGEDLRVEALIALRPEHFLRYVVFERLATGMDPAERLAFSDRIERSGLKILDAMLVRPLGAPSLDRRFDALQPHPLEVLCELTAFELLDVVQSRFRLLVALKGGVAEHHLRRHLEDLLGVDRVHALDEDGQPDFALDVGASSVRVECKNVSPRPLKAGPKVDFQRTRPSSKDPCTRYYAASDFEILAACLHPVSSRWEFAFTPTIVLSAHARCVGRLAPNVVVAGDHWTADIRQLLSA